MSFELHTTTWPQSVITVVGNPKPRSRTASAAAGVAELLTSELGPQYLDAEVIDLATIGAGLFGTTDPAIDTALEAVASASVLVVATPVYKASYTGLLKAFLDRLPGRGLAGTVVVPVTVSGSPAHRLLADIQLRPVLGELGASVPTAPVALLETDLDDLQLVLATWIAANGGLVRAAAAALQPVATPAS